MYAVSDFIIGIAGIMTTENQVNEVSNIVLWQSMIF